MYIYSTVISGKKELISWERKTSKIKNTKNISASRALVGMLV
jgi:hypothetical protein